MAKKMDKVYLLTKENQDTINSLAKNVTSLSGGEFEVEAVTQLRTNDVTLIWVLDALLEPDKNLTKKVVRSKQNFKERICTIPGCGEGFIPTNGNQKYCPEHRN